MQYRLRLAGVVLAPEDTDWVSLAEGPEYSLPSGWRQPRLRGPRRWVNLLGISLAGRLLSALLKIKMTLADGRL